MVIQHNLQALNANRQLAINTNRASKVQEKLSSGYKVNRSADDAAALSISEKMRRQIRGLNKTLENMQDGVSLCQTADGALTEVHEILQRMNELALKAVNGTNSYSDRKYIQHEVGQLTSEIDRIAYNTKLFETHPLLGDTTILKTSYSMPENTIHTLDHAEIYDGRGSIRFMANGMSQAIAGTWTDISTKPVISVRDAAGHTTGKVSLTGNDTALSYKNCPGLDKFITNYDNGDISFQIELSWKKVDCSTDSESREYFEFSYNFINTSSLELTFDFWVQMDMLVGVASNAIPDINGIQTPNTVKWTGDDIPEEMTVDNFVNLLGNNNTAVNVSAQYKWDGIHSSPDIVMSGDRHGIGFDNAMDTTKVGDLGYLGSDYFYGIGWSQRSVSAGSSLAMQNRIGLYTEKVPHTATYKYDGNPSVWIQMGADCGVGMAINLCNATAISLGVDEVNVLTEKSAESAIKAVSGAIQKVSEFRSYFGAQQNRLEHAVKINGNVVENTQAAESILRDANMTEMIVQHSIMNIFMQAGQSILSQSNQMSGMVLQLLS